MKKSFHLFLLLVLGCQLVSAQDDGGETPPVPPFGDGVIVKGELIYKILDDTGERKTVCVMGTTGYYPTTLEIPGTIQETVKVSDKVYDTINYDVVAIGNPDGSGDAELFANNSDIQTLIVGNNVEYIAPSAFSGCTSLESVSFGYALKTIGNNAFSNCSYLRTVTFNSDYIETIGEYAFAYCNSLETLSLPEGLSVVSDGMCQGCGELRTLVIPSTVESIGNNPFGDTYGNLDLYVLSDEMPYGFEDAFKWVNVQTLHLPYVPWAAGDYDKIWNSRPEISLYLRENEFMGGRNDSEINDSKNIYRIITGSECEFVGYINRDYGIGEDAPSVSVASWTALVGEDGSKTKYSVSRIAGKALYKADLSLFHFEENIQSIGKEAFADANIDKIRYTVRKWSSDEGVPVPTTDPAALRSLRVRKIVSGVGWSKLRATEPWSDYADYVTKYDDGASITTGAVDYTVRDAFEVDVTSFKDDSGSLEALEIPATFIAPDDSEFRVMGLKGNVFEATQSLKAVTIAKSSYALEYDADVVLPYSVESLVINRNLEGSTSLMPGAARSVSALKNITIGNNVNALGNSICDMPAGVAVVSNALKAPKVGNTLSRNPSTLTLTVPEGSIPDYRKAAYWSEVLNITDAEGNVLSLHVILPNGHLEFPQTTLADGKVRIVPDEGYKVNTATLHNGEEEQELTSDADGYYALPALVDHSRLNVVFAEQTPNALSAPELDRGIKVYASEGSIRIEGASDGASVTIFDTDGRILFRTCEHNIRTELKGVLILTVDGRTFKFAL